jgi:hypothetical protein
MDRPKFDAANPDLPLVRQMVLQRLRQYPQWEQLEDDNVKSFQAFVEFLPARPDDVQVFGRCVVDVFWQLVVEGILAPGKSLTGGHMQNLPWFHRTAYGMTAIAAGEYVPHDQTGYLKRLDSRIPNVDTTVLTYLDESLRTFLHGNVLASMVMLGVAAERVFDLVCDSLEPALADQAERAEFSKLLPLMSVRRKLDWVHAKLRRIEDRKRPTDYPDRASVMIVAIYELIRAQRNDFGHPREAPPQPTREDANAHLQIFPTYYGTAEALRSFLGTNKV